MATGPLTRGRAAVAASSQGEVGRGSSSPALARRETSSRGPRLPMRGLGSRCGAARGQLVEVLAGGPFFLWGKILTS